MSNHPTSRARRAPAPRPADWYTAAARAEHEKHCDNCRTLTEESNARAAANGASIWRRDRKTLGLILDMRTEAVAA
ncbi:hypothetical protein EAO71_27365 [Streptomyces sp. ms191]|uniref:hypothetical protein n=1 Tax=Streptomyces sp. ms191 TaxID=1827978 RepID=UPI0011CD392C|nr:hypothetical protein [Streptomyces sp. ms191]TXS21422.1 hypothetical protein EAO71_27365 [Streptomyces sp. ms191]